MNEFFLCLFDMIPPTGILLSFVLFATIFIIVPRRFGNDELWYTYAARTTGT